MQKSSKPSTGKSKKTYATPKLSTHGDVRKLTQSKPRPGPASNLLGNGHGHGHGND
jgi:hypothetical protein